MNTLNRLNLSYFHAGFFSLLCHKYFHLSVKVLKNEEVHKIRNIGILAHVDAGKTTTTERMLYYSGKIKHMGEVHHGNTVTDYLEQERNRGITITSASVTIPWLNHCINLIDTPGHIDFTFEVEQSLKVIDGAVIILDGSAGVEAQTVTVWRQADRYNVPRMVYINKMDRLDSDFEFCLKTLRSKFDLQLLILQLPVRGSRTGLSAILDIINMDLLSWSGDQGEKVTRTPLNESDDLYKLALKSRYDLVDKLTDLDDEIAELVLQEESLSSIGVGPIYDALQRITVNRKGVAVLCGSSYKNIGVQKLMDAIIHILPSPNGRKDLDIYNSFENNLCAAAFKVVHDNRKGPITFFRIYSGLMKKSQKLYIVNRGTSVQIQKLMIALADDYDEVNEVKKGNIAAVTGLKEVFSGDFVTNSASHVASAAKTLSKCKQISQENAWNLLCPRMIVPDPVFFCSIEAPSKSQQLALDVALEELQKEDPSFRVKTDPDTGQTIIGGMGELHLEIIKDRIRTKYKIDADIGPLQIAYKEFLTTSAHWTHSLKLQLGSQTHAVNITLTIFPKKDDEKFIVFDNSPENAANVHSITPKRLAIIKSGLEDGLQRGPKIGCPVTNAKFMLHHLEMKKMTSDSVLASATAQCVQKLLSMVDTIIIEPVMNLTILTDVEHTSFVMSDLSHRRADICEFSSRGNTKVVIALVPLVELLGYSKELRVGTSGNASFSMEFNCYKEVIGKSEGEVIKEVTGFYPVSLK